MTRARLILLVRCVTLLVVGALLLDAGWFYAGVSSLVLALMMPVFATCSTGCTYCSGCTPENLQVVVANLDTDQICTSCSLLNGTYVLSFYGFDVSSGTCEWRFTLVTTPSCGAFNPLSYFRVRLHSTATGYTAAFVDAAGSIQIGFAASGAVNADCTLHSNVTCNLSLGNYCSGGAANVKITAL